MLFEEDMAITLHAHICTKCMHFLEAAAYSPLDSSPAAPTISDDRVGGSACDAVRKTGASGFR